MIPKLTIDKESVNKGWNGKQDSIEYVIKHCKDVGLESGIPAYACDDNFVNMGVFNEFKSTYEISDFFEYGYCDTEDSLSKYLKSYVDDPRNSYFVSVGLMSMDCEKYYKEGSYINKDGVDTGDDYWAYIDEHPEMEVPQQFENTWFTFSIYKLKK